MDKLLSNQDGKETSNAFSAMGMSAAGRNGDQELSQKSGNATSETVGKTPINDSESLILNEKMGFTAGPLNARPEIKGTIHMGGRIKDPIAKAITSGHPMFHELLNEMRRIHNAKNADYGDGKQLGNFQEAEGFGVSAFQGVLIRISDKYSRIKSLSKKDNMAGEVRDESIEDTLIDLANYAILAIVVRRESKGQLTRIARPTRP
jgi:predicted nucleotide modification protein, DUF1599 family